MIWWHSNYTSCILFDLLASLLSLSSPTPLSPRSPAPMPPPSLSFSFSPCRREQVRLRRRRAAGFLAASAPTGSPVVTTETSLCRSVSSLHTSLSAWGKINRWSYKYTQLRTINRRDKNNWLGESQREKYQPNCLFPLLQLQNMESTKHCHWIFISVIFIFRTRITA